VTIGQCVPISFAQTVSEALAPSTTVTGAYAAAGAVQTATLGGTVSSGTAASVSATATVSIVTALPPVCNSVSGVVSAEQKAASNSNDPTIVKIFSEGFDPDTVVAAWAARISGDATLVNVVPRILSFGVPNVAANGDVTIPTVVEVVSSAQLTSTQLTNLCLQYQNAIASCVGKLGAQFSACTTTPIATSGKRAVFQNNPNQYVVSTTYSSSSSSGALLSASFGFVALLVAMVFSA